MRCLERETGEMVQHDVTYVIPFARDALQNLSVARSLFEAMFCKLARRSSGALWRNREICGCVRLLPDSEQVVDSKWLYALVDALANQTRIATGRNSHSY